MSKRTLVPLLCLSVLLLAALACNSVDIDEAQEPLGLPTLAPTAAPSPAPEQAQPTEPPPTAAPSSQYPQTIQASGTKISYSSSGETSCKVPGSFTLTLLADGTAQLNVTGASIVDHINCTQSTDETWIANGKFNETAQTVTFESCNFGNFSAQGSLSYTAASISGEVGCFDKNGGKWVSLVAGE